MQCKSILVEFKKTSKAGEFSFLSSLFFLADIEIKLCKEGEFSETTQEFNDKKKV